MLFWEASRAGNALGLPWDSRRGTEPLAGFPLLWTDPLCPGAASLLPGGAMGAAGGGCPTHAACRHQILVVGR